MSYFTCCFKASSETHSVQQIHRFLLGWRRNPAAPGDTHTSVLTAPALPEAMAPGLWSVPDEAETSSSSPSQQERNPQALKSVRGPPGLPAACLCMCPWCTRMCKCECTCTCMCKCEEEHLPWRALCSGARWARFRSALADSSLMALEDGAENTVSPSFLGFWLYSITERTVHVSCQLTT